MNPERNGFSQRPLRILCDLCDLSVLIVSSRATELGNLNEAGLASMFAGEVVTRSTLRWQVLHWSAGQPCLLPADLSSANGKGEELPLFSDSGCRG